MLKWRATGRKKALLHAMQLLHAADPHASAFTYLCLVELLLDFLRDKEITQAYEQFLR